MEQGWGGIGYLLFSKDFDTFTALVGCLKSNKFGKFLDLLESVSPSVTKMSDTKGRNLLLLLAKYIGELEVTSKDDLNLKKAMQVYNTLVKNGKSTDQFVSVKNVGLSLQSKDKRGYNILHQLALTGNIPAFQAFLELAEDKNSMLDLLKQKCTAKSEASPLVLLALRTENSLSELLKITNYLKKLYGTTILTKLPLDYTVRPSTHNKMVPQALDLDTPLISDQQTEPYKSHLIMHVFCDAWADEEFTDQVQLATQLSPFLNHQEEGTGMTLLMKLVAENQNLNMLRYLVGGKFDEDNLFVTYANKPRVNINLQDKKKKSALHYAIEPSKTFARKGVRQNVEVVQALVQKGANINLQDSSKMTPLSLVSIYPEIRTYLQPKSALPASLPPKAHAFRPREELFKKSYTAEAEAFLESQLAKIKAADKMQVDEGLTKEKPEVAVDEHEALKMCEVVRSEVDGTNGEKLFYDVVMIKIDVKHFYGVNAFYLLQIVYDKAKDMYILWTRWGRIGDFGQYQRTPFPNLLAARLEFEKVFRQKSGNKWENVVSFENMPGKYKLRRVSGNTVYITPTMRSWKMQDT